MIATSTTYYFIIHSWRMYDRGKTGGIEEAQNDVPARLVPRWIQPRCRFAPLWHQIRLEHESWPGHGDVTTIALHASACKAKCTDVRESVTLLRMVRLRPPKDCCCCQTEVIATLYLLTLLSTPTCCMSCANQCRYNLCSRSDTHALTRA